MENHLQSGARCSSASLRNRLFTAFAIETNGTLQKGCGILLFFNLLVASLLIAPSAFALQVSQPSGGSRPQSASSSKTVKEPDAAPQSQISFEDLIERSGIRFQLKNSITPQRYSIETMLGGVAVFDYNNDGLLDIFFTNGAAIPSLEKTDPSYWNRLYRNNGDGTFTDLTDKAGLGGMIAGHGKPWAVVAGWFDSTNSGHLDLIVINYLDYNIANAKLCSIGNARTYCAPGNFNGTPNILYKNNGDGTFSDVSFSSHIGQYVGKGMGLAFADYDNDGFTDVFVSNDTSPNFLMHNNGDGTFKDAALEEGGAYTANGSVVAGMGADFRDLNNDGLPEIFHTAMFGDTFPLYKNSGTQFDDVTDVSGMTAFSHRMTAWSTGAFDFDNDGWKDLFVAGGAILDNELEVLHRPALQPDGLLRNNGNLTFTDVSATAGSAILSPRLHRGAAFGSFHNDGKIDVVVSTINDKPQLLMNRTGTGNHWIILNLVGTKDNRDGLGTKVKIVTAEGVQYNHATTAVGYSSSSDKRVYFGLGKAAAIDRIELCWPTGVRQVLTNVKADQVLTVVEKQD